MAVIEERGDGEYAALLEEGDAAVVERVLTPLRARPGVQLTTARFPDQGSTAAELWAAALPPGVPTTPKIADTRDGVVVADPAMVQVFQLARKLAAVQTTVLILGETGVGKEVIARADPSLERARRRPVRAPQLRVAPGDAPRERALRSRARRVHRRRSAQDRATSSARTGGTIFLDEIGELPLDGPGEAPERPREPRGAARRRHAARSRSTCASSPRRTAISQAEVARGPLPRRSLLPAQRVRPARAAAPRAPGGDRRCSRRCSRARALAVRTDAAGARTVGRSRRSSATRGPATCAS